MKCVLMMIGSKPPNMLLQFLLLSITISFELSYCNGSSSITFCPEIEKQALITVKQTLKDPSNLLFSWNLHRQVNCCKWKGVLCSNLTGHVHQLRLQSFDLQGTLNPSLVNLKQLKYLDLSQNKFEETIPSFIGSLTRLEYLNLSYAGFHGRIPHHIGNLSSLRSLSVEPDYGSPLDVDSLEWLSGLSRLEELNMNKVNMSRAYNWAQVITALPSLVEVHFRSCGLNFVSPMDDRHVNNISTSLMILDLSGNEFDPFAIPRWIFKQNNLVFLDLSYNTLEGPIPSASNTTKLQHIDLGYNNLNLSIPDWLYLCKDLKYVYLGHNSLQNTISTAVGNLTSVTNLDISANQLSGEIPREIRNLCLMQTLDLSQNKLEGEILGSFGSKSSCFLASLEYLSLSGNKLSGEMSDEFGGFKRLKTLELGGNRLTGDLPMSMGQLVSLETLNIGENMLEGVVTETHFSNLTKLKDLYAGGNHLHLKVSPHWIPPFKLDCLEMRSWNLSTGPRFPSWIKTQKDSVWCLDLSDTGISGSLPSWAFEISVLNLSHNHLHGKIPNINVSVDAPPRFIYLSSNNFTGLLPQVANAVAELDVSNNSLSGGLSHVLCNVSGTYRLKILHLGGNQLTGELPDCWMQWPSLNYLNLGNNKLFGGIPDSIGFLTDLVSLNLYGNSFSGRIPSSMRNCTALVKVDLSSNDLVGNIPAWIGTNLFNLSFLILRSNKLSGEISPHICRLNSLQILDLSRNNLFGVIPRCVNNFTAMATKRSFVNQPRYSLYDGVFIESAPVSTKGNEYQYDTILQLVTHIDLSENSLSREIPRELASLVELRSLNLSGNHLTGLIPEGIGDMKQLESLDFSRNSLSGEIPNSFTAMPSLSYLNLSYNHLTGKIPESTQILGMNASSFIGNNLCGPPLPTSCDRGADDAHGPLHEDNESEIEWFYVFLSLGYAVGLSVFCTTLVLKKSWRNAYFGLLECMWNKVYVFVHIKWAKLTRK